VTAALRYEWVRVTTVRSTRICLVLALLFGAGIGYLVSTPQQVLGDEGRPTGAETVDWYGAFGFPLLLSVVLASVIASQSIGQEYRFGLIRLTLTAFPQRWRVIVSKLTGVVLVGVVIALISYLGSWIGVSLHGYALPPDTATAPDSTYVLRGVAFTVLWALSAYALSGITRQTAIGIAVPLVSGLVVEQILGAVLRDRADWLVKILPWSTAQRWAQEPVSGDPEAGGGGAAFGLLDIPVGWKALLVFVVWVVVLLVLETVAFLRRDA
jgi:ABC-type transport system involved in multi-copper enzyme maturation permease subunit